MTGLIKQRRPFANAGKSRNGSKRAFGVDDGKRKRKRAVLPGDQDSWRRWRKHTGV